MKTSILTIAVFVLMTIGVQAQPGFRGGMNPANNMRNQGQMRRGPEMLAKALNLSEDQKEAIKKIRLSMAKEIAPLRNAAGELKAHLKTLTSVDKPDLSAINQTIEKIGDQRIEIAKTATKYMLQMRSVLTDEQRIKLQALKGRMQQMKKFRRGNGMGFNPGLS